MTTTTSTLQAELITPGFTVGDIEASIAFYETLGFAIEERWEHEGTLMGVMISAGKGKMGLTQDDWKKGRDRVKGVGVSTWISTNQDVDEIANRAKAGGITLDSEPQDNDWGGRGFTVTDPDGFKMTISREVPK